MERQSIVERVRRLLALADSESNDNANEAEVAASMASKLMLEHKIEMADLGGTEFKDYVVCGLRVGEINVPAWRMSLISVIAIHNFCEVLHIRSRKARDHHGGSIFVVGKREDTEVVRIVHDHILKQIEVLRTRALQHLRAEVETQNSVVPLATVLGIVIQKREFPRGPALTRWKDQFNLGIVDGICVALEKQRDLAMQDEHTKAIVLHASSRSRQYAETIFDGIKDVKMPKKNVTDISAYAAGRVAAEVVDIGNARQRPQGGRYLPRGGS